MRSKLLVDHYVATFVNQNNQMHSLSAYDGITFKNQVDKKDFKDYHLINWGEVATGTRHSIIETGFFYDAVHMDTQGLYNFCSLNLHETKNIIDNFECEKTCREFMKEGKIIAKFPQKSTKETWDGIVLVGQHTTDRSVLKVGSTQDYYQFLEDAAKYYGSRLLIKFHPVNNPVEQQLIREIAEKHGASARMVGINIIDNCEFVLTYNSTFAVDSTMRNKPVVQYAPGYFWKTGLVNYSGFTLPSDAVPADRAYADKFLDFLLWKYCFHKRSPIEAWIAIFRAFMQSKELYPLPKEYSYAQYLLDR